MKILLLLKKGLSIKINNNAIALEKNPYTKNENLY